jgi:hypothetical protein
MGLAPVNHGLHRPSRFVKHYQTRPGKSKAIVRGAYSKLKARGKAGKIKARTLKKNLKVKKVVPAYAGPSMATIDAASIAGRELAPGVKHKVIYARAKINLLDIDLKQSAIQVRPIISDFRFGSLKDVREHSHDSGALAAINANYFKRDGVPLGTVMMDGDWVAGPLYERVALGFTDGGYARMARVSLHGTLHTSMIGHEKIWINNVNQPRRSGARCMLYTRRWGEYASLPYEGAMVAVSAQGEVIDTASKRLTIPYGGFVIADSKKSPISHLKRGEFVKIDWHINPPSWDNIQHAVSGGPLLLSNGKYAFNLKAERFPASWTGSQISRRTACGITADDHLLLATFEGPHTLYDVAKFFLRQGCTEAMNLDGGGSTTMVVNGATVTNNASASQRHVAVALGVFSQEKALNLVRCSECGYQPKGNSLSLSAFQAGPVLSAASASRLLGEDAANDSFASNPLVAFDLPSGLNPFLLNSTLVDYANAKIAEGNLLEADPFSYSIQADVSQLGLLEAGSGLAPALDEVRVLGATQEHQQSARQERSAGAAGKSLKSARLSKPEGVNVEGRFPWLPAKVIKGLLGR